MSDLQAERAIRTAPTTSGPAQFDALTGTTVGPPPDPSEELRGSGDLQVNRYLIALIVVFGLLVTFIVAFVTTAADESNRNEEFDGAAAEATDQIVLRFDDYAEALIGVRSLFETGEETTREEFDGYVAASEFSERLPGTLAVGYAPLTARDAIDDLEEEVRDEGFEDFEVTPDDGEADEVLPVVYLQPMEGYENAFGFDLAGNPRGREAIDQAIGTGEPTAGPVTRVLRSDGSDRAAFNLYLPVYDTGSRGGDITGVVFLLFSPEDAFSDLFADDAATRAEIYDLGAGDGAPGVEPTPANLLFDSDSTLSAPSGGSGLDQRNLTTVAGRRWMVYLQPGPGFTVDAAPFPWLVVVAGVLITGLLAALVVSFSQTRRQAVALADQITANLRAREGELQRANDDIVRSNRELERYASIAAHDLQEPLRSLLAYASVLERRYGETLDPEVLDQVQRMARAAERMRSLVVDLLAYARADSEQRKIEMVDLDEAIRIAIDDLSVLIHETGATIRVANLPTVPGNRRELIGVFSNLLSNALKYRSEAPPEVIVVAHQRGSEWVIGVRDNGIGIDPAYHERIFELFRRLEKRSTDAGTGLGLAICVRTVAQHGGRIWVESEEGKGATFWFTLPARAPKESQP
jgi:signal transduction histidine kinase